MRRILRIGLVLGCSTLLAGPALAGGASEAETLVRAVYYDGFPTDVARALDDEGVARLAEMLVDPAEASHHGNVVLALGLSGHADAFATLRDYAAIPPRGEVDRAAFRARTRVPLAMGYLSRDDDRALRWLLESTRRSGDPGWRFRHHGGDPLNVLLEEAALTGLALSGSSEAHAVLSAEAERPGSDVAAVRRRRHATRAEALREEIETRGPDAVLRGEAPR